MLIKKWFLRILIAIPVFILCVYFAVWGLSPAIARYFLADFLAPHNLQLQGDSRIRFNPFTSHLLIKDFVVSDLILDDLAVDDSRQTYLRIDNLNAEVDLYRFFSGEIRLSEFVLDGVFFKGKQTDDDVIIAGIRLSQLTTADDSDTRESVDDDVLDNSDALPYRISVPDILIKNMTVDFDNKADSNVVTLDMLAIKDITYQEMVESDLSQNDGSKEDLAEGKLLKKLSSQLSVKSIDLVLANIQVNQQTVKLTAKKYQLKSENLTLNLIADGISVDPLVEFTGSLSTELTSLHITHDSETYFRMDQLRADASLQNLVENGIVLNELLFNGIFLKAKQSTDELIIAGINLTQLASNEQVDKENVAQSSDIYGNATEVVNNIETGNVEENRTEENIHSENSNTVQVNDDTLGGKGKNIFPYRVHASKILVTNMDIDFENNADSNLLTLEKLLINNVTYSDVAKDELMEGKVLTIVSSQLSVESINLVLANLNLNQQALNLTMGKYLFASKDMSLNLTTDDVSNEPVIDFSSTLSSSLSSLNITNESKDNVVLRLNDLTLPKIDVAYSKHVSVVIPSVELTGLVFSEKNEATANTSTSLLALKSIGLTNIELTESSAVIDTLSLNALASNIIISADKSIATLVAMPGSENNTADVAPEKDKAKAKRIPESVPIESSAQQEKIVGKTEDDVFVIALNKITLVDGAEIFFNDQSVSPHYKRTFFIDTLDAGPFDNQKPQQKSAFNVMGRSDEYSSFQVVGDITPFSKKLNLSSKVTLRELSLPDTSAYVKNALGFELETGQLDTDITVVVVEDIIDGKVNIHLRGMNMTAADDYQAGSLKDQTSVPLNVALGMLQDKKGNIKLDVPLAGSVDDPSFGLDGFMKLVIKKAVISATQSYLIKTFVPYANVLSVVKTSGEFLLKLRFEDLPYPVGVVELQAEQITYADQFAQLLKDKPKEQIKVCGIATPEEIGLPQGSEVTDAVLIDQMQKIALERAKLFKDYVVQTGGIESSRLLLCHAQLDFKTNAKPRISLSI